MNQESEDAEYEKIENNDKSERIVLASGLVFVLFLILLITLGLSSCTISFTNISTHGTANDLVDEEQVPSTSVSPNLTIPLKGI